MGICDLLNQSPFMLMEAAVIEALEHSGETHLHPQLENALLIYRETDQAVLSAVYQEFIDIARHANVPLVLCTPTWRANRERLDGSQISQDVNGDAVRFMKRLSALQHDWTDPILIGGLIGCKNDCYRPREGLAVEAARTFHTWQVQRLAKAGPDFLMAATLPALDEATGMALAMAETQLPYIISFVINRQGRLLDGSSLADAIHRIDAMGTEPPVGYMINCAYPSFFDAERQTRRTLDRIIGFQGNASSLDQAQLNSAKEQRAEDLSDWGDRMVALNRSHGIKILGGCCGTRPDHLRYLVDHLVNHRVNQRAAPQTNANQGRCHEKS